MSTFSELTHRFADTAGLGVLSTPSEITSKMYGDRGHGLYILGLIFDVSGTPILLRHAYNMRHNAGGHQAGKLDIPAMRLVLYDLAVSAHESSKSVIELIREELLVSCGFDTDQGTDAELLELDEIHMGILGLHAHMTIGVAVVGLQASPGWEPTIKEGFTENVFWPSVTSLAGRLEVGCFPGTDLTSLLKRCHEKWMKIRVPRDVQDRARAAAESKTSEEIHDDYLRSMQERHNEGV